MNSVAPPDWSAIRSRFPVLRRWIYLNTASVGPLPRETHEAVEKMERIQMEDDRSGLLPTEACEGARNAMAGWVGVPPGDLALTCSTTEGISRIAIGIPLSPGEEIVLPADEFPANVYPWRCREPEGARLLFVPPRDPARAYTTEKEILASFTPRTRLLAVSWVSFLHGYRYDLDLLGAACRDRGVWLAVDAIQGIGGLALDLARTPVDSCAWHAPKWLLAPETAAYLYVRRESLRRLRPTPISWLGVRREGLAGITETSLPPHDGAQRFDAGAHDYAAYAGAERSLALLAGAGAGAVESRILSLTDRLIAGLDRLRLPVVSCREAPHRSGIVSFGVPDPSTRARTLREAGILIAPRGPYLRASAHLFNDEDDIDRLLTALR